MIKWNWRSMLLGMGCVLLASCASAGEVRNEARNAQQQANSRAQDYWQGRPALTARPVVGPVVTDTPYVDSRPISRIHALPPSFNREVTLNEPSGMTMQALANRVQALTGIRVEYQTEVHSPRSTGSGSGADMAFRMPPMPPAGGSQDATLAGALPPLPVLPSSTVTAPISGIPITYTGNVEGLFNAVAAATDSEWEYNDAARKVSFYRYRVATFTIPAVQGVSTSSAAMGGASQGGGDSQPMSMASAAGTHTTESNIWGGIEATVKQLLSSEGVYSMDSTAGLLVVRDRPDRISTIRRYLDQASDSLSRQVNIEVDIYRVVVNDRDHQGVNWNVLFQTLAAGAGYNIQLMGSGASSAGSDLASAVLSIPQHRADGSPRRFGGSSVMFDALSRIGRTSTEQSTSVMTANNQPAPVKVVRRTSYLAEWAQNIQNQGGTTASTGPTLTPGMIETGLNMYVLPHVQDDGKRLLLKFMGSLSTLDAMDSAGNAQAQIQLPQVSSREFFQQAWLNSGETLVLAGFQQTDAGLDTRAPFGRAWFLGGNREASRGREMVVITIRPVVTAARSRI